MKKDRRKGLPPWSEYGVIAVLLALYALVIFLSPDPEWVVWAGQMSVGVIDPAALPPAAPVGTVEALRTAAGLSGLGLRPDRLSRPAGHAVAAREPGGHGTGRRT